VALVLGSVCAFERHTISQVLLVLGVTEQDWSGRYRLFSEPQVDVDALSAELVRQTLAEIPAGGPNVAAMDGVQVPSWSLGMPGTSWLKASRTPRWRPGIHRAHRFFHLAALLPITEHGYRRALPLRWVPAFPPKAVPARTSPQTEGQPQRRSCSGWGANWTRPVGPTRRCWRWATAATTRPRSGRRCRRAPRWPSTAPRIGPERIDGPTRSVDTTAYIGHRLPQSGRSARRCRRINSNVVEVKQSDLQSCHQAAELARRHDANATSQPPKRPSVRTTRGSR
jgi:hypothetical protein